MENNTPSKHGSKHPPLDTIKDALSDRQTESHVKTDNVEESKTIAESATDSDTASPEGMDPGPVDDENKKTKEPRICQQKENRIVLMLNL